MPISSAPPPAPPLPVGAVASHPSSSSSAIFESASVALSSERTRCKQGTMAQAERSGAGKDAAAVRTGDAAGLCASHHAS